MTRRPTSGHSYTASSEESSSLAHTVPRSPSPLSPPRPFFIAGASRSESENRHSGSSFDPASASDSDSPPPVLPAAARNPARKPKSHARRSSSQFASYAPLEVTTPPHTSSFDWSPDMLYADADGPASPPVAPAASAQSTLSKRPPPSSFSAYSSLTGGTVAPEHAGRRPSSRGRDSVDPLARTTSHKSSQDSIQMVPRAGGGVVGAPSSPSWMTSHPSDDLVRPRPPFMAETSGYAPERPSSSSSLSNNVFSPPSASLPRNSSATSFRMPFLSPASRPSSVWAPPSVLHSPGGSSAVLPVPPQKLKPSTRLPAKLTKDDKPWMGKPRGLDRLSWWLTVTGLLLGVLGGAALCYLGYESVDVLPMSDLCLVMDDEFDTLDLTNNWSRDVELGGFGNGEFEMTTDSDANSYVKNGQLYILPTLTSNSIDGGYNAVLNGATYNLPGCTADIASPSSGGNTTSGSNSTSTGNSTTGGTTNNGGGNNGGNTNNNGGNNGGGNNNGDFVLYSRQNNGNNNGNGGNNNNGNGNNDGNSTSSGNSTSGGGGGGPTGNACTAISDSSKGTVINPVMSARLNTRGKKSIAYGRVEVRAKLPQGDWLWPAIWMLPEGNSSTANNASSRAGVYGDWPMSGEIDIMEARGNPPSYPAQGSNYVRSSLNYGPFSAANTPIQSGSGSTSYTATLLKTIYGWATTKRGNYADGFHTYAFEWTDSWMRFYTDSRLQAMINLKMTGNGGNGEDTYFFKSGGFPPTAMNASSGYEVVVTDPWTQGSNAAPFDQQFYLILDLAVGGISGWFPDNTGNKMWYDNSATAMQEFAKAQSDWYATWPTNEDDLAFRIDYVKMWKLCGS